MQVKFAYGPLALLLRWLLMVGLMVSPALFVALLLLALGVLR
jgi:hypothetical protein